MTKRVLILGGDGYIGWPLSMALSKKGYEVAIMDNLSKRKWQMEMGVESILAVLPTHQRILRFKESYNKEIHFFIGDLTNVGVIYHCFDQFKPDYVVFAAGQCSSAFSMTNRTNAVQTQTNNLNALLNTIFAIRRSKRQIPLIYMDHYHGISNSFFDAIHTSMVGNIHFASKNWKLSSSILKIGNVYGLDKISLGNPLLTTQVLVDDVFSSLPNRYFFQAYCQNEISIYGDGSQVIFLTPLQELIDKLIEDFNRSSLSNCEESDFHTHAITEKSLAECFQGFFKDNSISIQIKYVENPRFSSEYSNSVKETLLARNKIQESFPSLNSLKKTNLLKPLDWKSQVFWASKT